MSLDAGAPEASGQHRLLALQDLDTLADQLAVRRRSLPERAHLAALDAEAGALRSAVAARETTRRTLLTEQERLEGELAAADARATELTTRLRNLFVTREAEAVMAEQRALAGRRSDLEDRILERMGAVADLDDEDVVATKAGEELAARRAAAAAALATAEQTIDDELADVTARRAAVASTVPEALLVRYEPLRRSFGGVAVARLENGRCLGCHLTLSTSEVDRIRHEPPDALVECEHCGRILVR